jgi:hypothetical protein
MFSRVLEWMKCRRLEDHVESNLTDCVPHISVLSDVVYGNRPTNRAVLYVEYD